MLSSMYFPLYVNLVVILIFEKVSNKFTVCLKQCLYFIVVRVRVIYVYLYVFVCVIISQLYLSFKIGSQ